jgi:transcriptional regulator with GAF, ATPase, and Fis domain
MTLKEHLRATEREYVRRILEECGWCVNRAAARAGVHRAQMYNIMRRCYIQQPPRRVYGNAAWQSLGA